MRKKVLIIGGAGYIGSMLAGHLASRGFSVSIDDHNWFPNLGRLYYPVKIEEFDVVIFLAGLSSVAMSKAAGPAVTFHHNVQKFVDCLEKVHKDQLFLYASSASVYGNSGNPAKEYDELEPALNVYDMSKQMIDIYAAQSGKYTLGLRFGSVNGYSPNPRLDMIVPMMMHSAKTEGVIRVTCPNSCRAILSTRDLCRGIEAILKNKEPHSGVYNMCSLNDTIGRIAERVGKVMNIRPTYLHDVTTQYSFQLNTEKFEGAFDFEFDKRLGAIIEDVQRIDWGSVCKHPDKYRRAEIPGWVTQN